MTQGPALSALGVGSVLDAVCAMLFSGARTRTVRADHQSKLQWRNFSTLPSTHQIRPTDILSPLIWSEGVREEEEEEGVEVKIKMIA